MKVYILYPQELRKPKSGEKQHHQIDPQEDYNDIAGHGLDPKRNRIQAKAILESSKSALQLMDKEQKQKRKKELQAKKKKRQSGLKIVGKS